MVFRVTLMACLQLSKSCLLQCTRDRVFNCCCLDFVWFVAGTVFIFNIDRSFLSIFALAS